MKCKAALVASFVLKNFSITMCFLSSCLGPLSASLLPKRSLPPITFHYSVSSSFRINQQDSSSYLQSTVCARVLVLKPLSYISSKYLNIVIVEIRISHLLQCKQHQCSSQWKFLCHSSSAAEQSNRDFLQASKMAHFKKLYCGYHGLAMYAIQKQPCPAF